MAGAERLAGIIPTFSQGHAVDRRVRRAVQVPAGAERMRAAAARRADRARRARRLRDLVRHPVAARPVPPSPETSAALDDGVRRARHHADHRPPRQRARSGAQRRGARRRHRAAVRPLPRRAQAPRARRGDRERHDRGRLRARGLGDAARRASPASTRSATSPRPACRRPACSPRAPRASSRRR